MCKSISLDGMNNNNNNLFFEQAKIMPGHLSAWYSKSVTNNYVMMQYNNVTMSN